MKPTICRVVQYRSRTGKYTVPAIITATVDTLNPDGVQAWHDSNEQRQALIQEERESGVPEQDIERLPLKGVPPLSSPNHVHLTVLTPGLPGQRTDAQDFLVRGVQVSENQGGTYQEWDIPMDTLDTGEQSPGTWAWPPRT